MIPSLFSGPEVLSSASDNVKLFAKNFSQNSNLDDLGISLAVFPSRTNLELHNISLTPEMAKKFIMNLDLSKASGLDCIPVVVLKNFKPELCYILSELFNKCLKESCFADCWKVSSVVLVFRDIGERSRAKNYHPFSLLSVVSKVFQQTHKPNWVTFDSLILHNFFKKKFITDITIKSNYGHYKFIWKSWYHEKLIAVFA